MKFKKVWTILIIFALATDIFATPVQAADYNFTDSNFKANSDGTLTHTYTVNGTKKEQKYADQKADNGNSVYKNGSSYFGKPLFIYEMVSSEVHKNWGVNCSEGATIDPKTSKFYLVVRKRGDNDYVTEGIFFQQQCTNSNACGDASNILGKKYYFLTQDFSGHTGDDCEKVYNTESEFYKYLTYLNSRNFAVSGLTSETSKECSISGEVQVDFTKQNLTGDEKDIEKWPDIKKKGYLGSSLVFDAQLWYKGSGSAVFISAEEKAQIQDDGSYKFPAKSRPVGQYVVTFTIKRTKNSPSFQPGLIDPAFENQELNLIDPSYYPAFSDQGDLEYFFGKSNPINIEKNCQNVTGQNLSLYSIGIKEQKGSSSGDTCGISISSGVFTQALGGALCALIDLIGNFTAWIMLHLFGTIFNA